MRQQQQSKPVATVAADPAITTKQAVRKAFVLDGVLTETGFTTFEKATEAADLIVRPDAKGNRDSDERRVRVRFRSRTQLWDVVVKSAKVIGS